MDFSTAFSNGFLSGQQRAMQRQSLDMDKVRLALAMQQFDLQKPIYGADLALKEAKVKEIQAALDMYPQLQRMFQGQEGQPPTPAITPQADNTGISPSPGSAGPVPAGGVPATVRNNNPGAIMPGGQMANYPNPQAGAVALNGLLTTSYTPRQGITNLVQFFSKYAPAGHGNNNPQAYAAVVGRALGIGPNDPIDVNDPQFRSALMNEISKVEGGQGAGNAFNLDLFQQAAKLPNSAPPQGLTPYQPPIRVAQNNTNTATDASGPPQGGSFSTTGAPTGSSTGGGNMFGLTKEQYAWLVQMAAIPGQIGERARNMLTAAKQAQDLAAYETPEQRRQAELKNQQSMADYNALVDYTKQLNLNREKRQQETDTPKMSENLNVLSNLAPKIQSGNATDAEKRQYALAFQNEYGKIQTMPDGSQVRIAPPANIPVPEGFETQVAGQKPMTPQDAARQAAYVQGANVANQIEQLLFPGGKYDTFTALKMHLPGTDAGQVKDLLQVAIDAKIRAMTGAAANKDEMSRYMSTFLPSPFDTQVRAANKLKMLKDFFASTLELSGNRGVKPAEQSGASGQNLKAKYGLE